VSERNQRDDCRDGVFSLDVTLRSHRRWLRLLLTKVTLPADHKANLRRLEEIKETVRVGQTCNLTYCPTVTFVTFPDVTPGSRRT
jgi:hypothetical protein